ncbi:desulfoferrodoxin family protein [Thiomonas sp. X19]|uniref:desulfoferrodoxin family protein n=1 Tax=Thiomonas sp. X19 TaxID=1050370 RepID=UPI0011BFBA66|nr:desulfoferrodoxin family protein [Thiomonas sp. X19]
MLTAITTERNQTLSFLVSKPKDILMQRRQFVATSLATAAAAVTLPRVTQAAELGTSLENVVFTAADPGHWKAVEIPHVPILEVKGDMLHVQTPHPMTKPHFIVSHTVVLGDGTFLSRKTFDWHDQSVSVHKLPAGYKGKLRVTSTCNLHDLWLKDMTI